MWGVWESYTLQSKGVNGGNVLRNIKTDIRQLRIEMVSSGSRELPLTLKKREKDAILGFMGSGGFPNHYLE
jgi:hypothetical protein